MENKRSHYPVWGEKRHPKSPVTRRRVVGYKDALEEMLDSHIAHIDRILAQ